METRIAAFAEGNIQEYIRVLKKLIEIPAPSYGEEKISRFLMEYLQNELERTGYPFAKVRADDSYNVYCEIGDFGSGTKGCGMIMAHVDTVFPDDEIFWEEREGCLYGPGAKDNRANVCALLFCAKYIFSEHFIPERPLTLVFDSCEEGTGNLKGCRRAFEAYQNVEEMVAFDLDYETIFNKAVGSVRYRLEISVPGGHALNDFGNLNAIVLMSEIIQKFYEINVGEMEGRTTYNVGLISGGTSVNTIAQKCEAFFEWRSDCEDSIKKIESIFEEIIKMVQEESGPDMKIIKTLIGTRPSMGVFSDEKKQQQERLEEEMKNIILQVTGKMPGFATGSTDCNIPLSRGIPAVCIGTCIGKGEHTREEYIRLDSLRNGLEIALKTMERMSR